MEMLIKDDLENQRNDARNNLEMLVNQSIVKIKGFKGLNTEKKEKALSFLKNYKNLQDETIDKYNILREELNKHVKVKMNF